MSENNFVIDKGLTINGGGNIDGVDNIEIAANIYAGNLVTLGTAGDIVMTGGSLLGVANISSDASLNLYAANSSVNINALNTTINSGLNTWTFGNDGNITLPNSGANINYANGSPYGGAATSAAGNTTEIQFNQSNNFSASPNFTFNSESNTLTVTGDANVSNLNASANVNANGNVTGGNILTTGIVSTTGNVYSGNIIATDAIIGNISLTGNVDLVDVSASGNISAGGNISGGNILTSGAISTGGNISGGNVLTTNISLSGNVLSAINSAFDITTTGNIAGGNVLTDNLMYANGQPWNLQQAAGSNTQIQFNNNGNLAGNVNLTYDGVTLKVNDEISVPTITSTSHLNLIGINQNPGTGFEGGDINILGGKGANSVGLGAFAGTGGDITITGGDGGHGDGHPGAQGGVINIVSGAGGSSGANGAGAGGSINILASTAGLNNGNFAAGNLGGFISIQSGATTLENAAGGQISLTTGTGGPGGAAGNLTINVPSSDAGSGGIWTFNSDSNLTIPGGIIGNGNLYVYPNSADTSGRLDIFLTSGPDIHIAGVGENLILGRDDTSNVTIGVDGNVYVQASTGSPQTWKFATNGDLNLPGGTAYIGASTDFVGMDSNTQSGLNGVYIATNDVSSIYNQGIVSVISNYGGTSKTWSFDNTGNLHVPGLIKDLINPVDAQDAATKSYVDTVAQGLHVHDSCNVATTQDLAVYTGASVSYNNGTGGVGATLTFSGNTLTTVDGFGLSSQDRILVKNEANAVYNGIYVYSNATVLTRAVDFDTDVEGLGGDFVFVTSGNVNADTGWVQTTDAPSIGNSNIVWQQFSSAGAYTANTSAGLTLNGTEFSATVDNITTAFDINGNISVKPSAELTTPNIGAATGTSLSLTGNINTSGLLVNGGSGITANAGNIDINYAGGFGGWLNATGANLSGNVTANYFLGNGSQLTAINAATVDVLDTNGLGTTFYPTFVENRDSAEIIRADVDLTYRTDTNTLKVGNISSTGNITGGNIIGTFVAPATTANTYVLFNDANVISGSGVFTFDKNGNVLTIGTTAGTLKVADISTPQAGVNLRFIPSSGTTLSYGNLNPQFANTYDLGSSSSRWNNLFANVANAVTLNTLGNVTGGNVLTGGLISAAGNIYAANLGNVSALNLNGNASQVLYGNGVFAAGSNYGDSNVVTLVAAFGSNTVSTTGNITSGNFNTTGIANSANILLTGGYVNTSTGVALNLVPVGAGGTRVWSKLVPNANVAFSLGSTTEYWANGYIGNLISTTVSATGNITGGNVLTGGIVSATANITGGNLLTGGLVSATGNVNAAGATFTGNVTAQNFSGNISITGNVTGTSANVQLVAGSYTWTFDNTGNTSYPNGIVTFPGATNTGVYALDVGVAAAFLSNTVTSFTANVNNYTQLTLQNINTGADATADYIITADNGSDTVNYADFGIINSGYDNLTPTNSLGNIVFAADTYLYAQGNVSNTAQSGGNLVIGATVSSKTVKIFAGGSTNSALIANISNIGVAVTGVVSATGNVTGGNIITGGLISATGNITGGNVSVTGNITGNTNGFAIGYRDIPQVSFAANATISTSDAGKHYYSTSASNLVLTIANNSSQGFAVGAAINIINRGTGTMTIAQGSGVTLYLAGNTTSGNRTLSSYGAATIQKIETDVWFIVGTGLT